MMMGGWGFGPGFGGGYLGAGGYWWMGLIGMALQLIFWLALIIAGVYLIRWIGRAWTGPSQRHDALEVLRERYARGEIGAEEYQRLKQDLQV